MKQTIIEKGNISPTVQSSQAVDMIINGFSLHSQMNQMSGHSSHAENIVDQSGMRVSERRCDLGNPQRFSYTYNTDRHDCPPSYEVIMGLGRQKKNKLDAFTVRL